MSTPLPGENVAKANPEPGTLPGVANRAVTADRNEKARAYVRRVVENDYGGNQAAAAKAFGITPSLLSEFLGGTRGAGMTFLEGVADVTGASIDEIVGRRSHESSARPVIGALPGYDDAEAQVRAMLKNTPEWVFTCARQVSGLVLPAAADVTLVMRAVDLARELPPPGTDTAETTAAKAEIARVKAEASRSKRPRRAPKRGDKR